MTAIVTFPLPGHVQPTTVELAGCRGLQETLRARIRYFVQPSYWLCLQATPAVALDQVRLAQNQAPISGISIIAKAKGFFEANGLDVTVIEFHDREAMPRHRGRRRRRHRDNRRIADHCGRHGEDADRVSGTNRIFRSEDAGRDRRRASRRPLDLKGKRIAYTAGTGSEVYTWTLLRSAKMETNDVPLVNLRPQEMAPALAGGSIDAYDTWEPHVINGKKALGDKVAQLDTKGVYSETFNIVVMRDYAEKNPKIVRAFLKSLIEAEAWMKANRGGGDHDRRRFRAYEARRPGADLERVRLRGGARPKVMDILKAHSTWRLATGNASAECDDAGFHYGRCSLRR